ncbi:hypothetical protein SAMD00019534_111590 [Acytostelium subglobosum LB1]|uniref:hypothetical protein n=1 Tax=Acytostelium subglobosum LB1 TaxID=1410327 RepID=UPI000644F333|nr:hypothetical protein SAMD00019534_111590 [Acytostelium subglobosum LB1]GAM27983.1 hypothetical protein SAMD00019534_111590 [Acytostelium subglobosum LB1]|eukprot:XP_012748942.1 hypothetical protein SAMD00019534_111590 [Acytostelium subglobosum LB1]
MNMELEDGAASDPKYKQFNDELNTVLVAFAKSAEWADLVKWLGKLSKLFEKYPKSNCIQPKLLLSKRMSQCLNPSLPSGCHSQTLDTYALIFSRIGKEKLSTDISIYATGLFPLFRFASTDVRYKVLSLYEKHLLPMGHKLHSCLNGVVSSLLPGLDEGTGEMYEAVKKLLEAFCRETSTPMFYHALWKTLVTTPNNRQAGIEYLLTHLPKNFDDLSLRAIYLPEKDTLVAQAMYESLSDTSVLVRRSMLELITGFFPISIKIFSDSALENIIKAAVRVVTYKDASLNKRLNSWLLGNDKEAHQAYFIKYGRQPTINAFRQLLINLLNTNETAQQQQQQLQQQQQQQQQSTQQAQNKEIVSPLIILTFLFQKDEFQVIMDGIIVDILRCLHKFKEGYSFSKDVVRYADEVFALADQTLIWNFLNEMLAFNNVKSVLAEATERLKLVESFLDVMPLSVEEVQTQYLPAMLLAIVRAMKNIIRPRDNQLIIAYTHLCLRVIGKIIVEMTPAVQTSIVESIEAFREYFVLLCDYLRDSLSQLNMPPPQQVQFSISGGSHLVASNAINFTCSPSSNIFIILDHSLQVLGGLFHQFKPSSPAPAALETSMPNWFFPIYNFCLSDNPFICCLAIKAIISMTNNKAETSLSKSFRKIITDSHYTALAKKLWSLLEPQNCAVHYQVANLYLSLREMNEYACSSVISEAMLETDINKRVEGYQKFALFWRLTGELGNTTLPFSNTLFLMLDSLHDDQPIIRLTGHTWLADSIGKAERILDPLLRILLDKSTIRTNHIYHSIYDARRVIYAFKILKSIIECDFKLFIQHVIEKPISKDIVTLNTSQSVDAGSAGQKSPATEAPATNRQPETAPYMFVNGSSTVDASSAQNKQSGEAASDFSYMPANSYIDLLVVVALRFMQGSVPPSIDQSTPDGQSIVSQNGVVQICAAEFLQYLLVQTTLQPVKALEVANNIQEPILQNLAQAVSTNNMVLQVHLLALLRSIVSIDCSGGSGGSNNVTQDSLAATGNTSPTSITKSVLFLHTTILGLTQSSARFNIRFYWLDFINFCLPRMATSTELTTVAPTIMNCLRELVGSFDTRSLYDSLTSRDIIVLLKSIAFIFKMSVIEPLTPFQVSVEETQSSSRGGVRLLTDFVKDVFTSEMDPSTALTPIGKLKGELLDDLPNIITPLIKLWGSPKSAQSKISMSTDVSSDTHNKYAIQDLIIHIFDPLMTKYPMQFISSIIEVWQKSDLLGGDATTRKVIIEILSSMESVREETVFKSCSQILAGLHAQERAHRNISKSVLHKIALKESALYDFVYKYIDEASIYSEGAMLNSFQAFTRESLSSLNPMTYVSQLQILNLYIRKFCSDDKVKGGPASTTVKANSSRVNKKDLQDLVPKIVEACFVISGKSFNDVSALYVAPGSSLADNSMRTQPADLAASLPASLLQTPPSAYTYAGTTIGEEASNSNAPANSASASTSNNAQRQGGRTTDEHDSGSYLKKESLLRSQVGLKSLSQLSSTLASLLDTIFDDKEKVATLLANSLHNVVPYLKSKGEHHRENTCYAATLFASLAEYPYNIKSIRKDTLELFFDNDFFKLDIKSLEQAGKFINQIMIHDKTAFSDFIKLLSKSWTPPSALTFNKETESINRARHLKRLSFILWSGAENQHLSILPLVLEKIVESLRIPNAILLHLQVFQCLRVLLVRISHENLRPFWPVILTEMIDILSHAEFCELVLAACKFLDLALTLPSITEQFSLFEWVFIKDCFLKHQAAPFHPYVDSISQNPVEFNEDMDMPFVTLTSSGEVVSKDPHQLLRPCILIRTIGELPNGYQEFKAFLSKFSLSVYKRHLDSNAVDYLFINEQLIYDFCELELTKVELSKLNQSGDSDATPPNSVDNPSDTSSAANNDAHHWMRISHPVNGSSNKAANFLERPRLGNSDELHHEDSHRGGTSPRS